MGVCPPAVIWEDTPFRDIQENPPDAYGRLRGASAARPCDGRMPILGESLGALQRSETKAQQV